MSQSEFYRGVEAAAAALAAAAGGGTADAGARATAVHDAFARLDDDRDAVPARACRRGCDHCCHLPVGITFGEASRLAAAISPAAATRVLAAARHTEGLSWRELVGVPCPLLDDHACCAHAARPLACRALASGDAGPCERALRQPVPVPFDRSLFWRGLGAGDVLAAAEPANGHRELRGALAALLQTRGPMQAPAFAAARAVGENVDGAAPEPG